MFLVQTLK
uniref:Uncharacterized protein n=1 Tax=Oryza nivara TaxID=4536 RepID=A0A0G2KBP4_ORYNI